MYKLYRLTETTRGPWFCNLFLQPYVKYNYNFVVGRCTVFNFPEIKTIF